MGPSPFVSTRRAASGSAPRASKSSSSPSLARNCVALETNPVNYRLSAYGFLAEIDRMQLEVREYLSLPAVEAA